MPVRWLASLVCLLLLLRYPSFDRAELWNPAPVAARLTGILLIFSIGAVLIGAGVRRFAPHLYSFSGAPGRASGPSSCCSIRRSPSIPRGIIDRAFLIDR